jgi:hypothetical protein
MFAAECTAVSARSAPCFCNPDENVCVSISFFISRDAGVSRDAPDLSYPVVVLVGPASCWSTSLIATLGLDLEFLGTLNSLRLSLGYIKGNVAEVRNTSSSGLPTLTTSLVVLWFTPRVVLRGHRLLWCSDSSADTSNGYMDMAKVVYSESRWR